MDGIRGLNLRLDPDANFDSMEPAEWANPEVDLQHDGHDGDGRSGFSGVLVVEKSAHYLCRHDRCCHRDHLEVIHCCRRTVAKACLRMWSSGSVSNL